MKIGDFFIALGFDVDDKTLKSFNDSLNNTLLTMGKMAAVGAAAVYSINKFVASSVDNSIGLRNFADQTGYATEEVERLYNVIGRANPRVTLEQTTAVFKTLADTIADAKLGKGALGEAGMLGIYDLPTTTPLALINKLREQFKTTTGVFGSGDPNVTRRLMEGLGIPSEFMPMITMPESEFQDLWGRAIPTSEQRASLAQLGDDLKELGFQWELFKARISAQISPYLSDFLKSLIPYLDEAVPLLREFSMNIAAVITEVAKFTSELGEDWQTGLGAIALVLVTRWHPVLVLFTALAAAMNDVGAFIRGDDGTYTGKIANVVKDLKSSDNFLSGASRFGNMLHAGVISSILGEEAGARVAARYANQSNNQTNTFNIQTNGDAMETGLEINRVMDRLNKNLMDEQGYGAYYETR